MFGLESLFFLLLIARAAADDSCPGLPTCFCNKAKTSVNCDGKHFKEIPSTIPITVEKLYLRYNQIVEIKTSAFSQLPQLEKIWLTENIIGNIEPYAFQNLTKVNYIDLQQNKISNVGPFAFAGMPNLESLYLTTNQIMSFNETAFMGDVSLKSIYVQANKLKDIPTVGEIPSLEKLVLEGNNINNATFPECFQNNSKLSYIVLSNNQIKTLDNNTFMALNNNSMSTLYISRNLVTETSSGVFSPFRSIASLKLGTNPLGPTALKMAIESLQGKDMVSLDLSDLSKLHGGLLADTFALLKNTSITTLNMKRVIVSSLPDNVFLGLNKLLHLDLSSCQMQKTGNSSFNGLDKLTILNLQKNKLTSVPQRLPETLEKLFLDDNQITTIENKAFANLGRLQELRITYNYVLTLMQDTFLGLTSLRILDLYGNQLATLPGKVFSSLVRLTSLTLAKNNFVTIQNATGRFSSQASLIYLNMADNHCSKVSKDIFSDLNSLQYLRLEGNSLGEIIQNDYDGGLFKSLRNLRELRLMGNGVGNLPGPTLQNMGELILLNVSNNRLTGWDKDLFEATSKLKVIDFSNNLIANVKPDMYNSLPKSMISLNFTANPFMCDCNLRDFRDWINKTSVIVTNNASYICNGPAAWKDKPLMSFDRKKINCLFFTWWQILIACAVGACLVIIIVFALYKKRWWIKLFIYKRMRATKVHGKRAADGHGNYGAIEPKDPEFVHDAFVSYSQDDLGWVKANLLPGIDKGSEDDEPYGGKFALYLEERDAQPGRSLVGAIYENMSSSRYVIVILSRNYLGNDMNLFELDLAINQMYEGKLMQVIYIHTGDGLPKKKIPKHLAHTMKRNKLLEWSENADAKELVKRRLIETLESRNNEKAVDIYAE